ncbi:MAG TPA: GNAT family N-acetyltransferase [Actinomycetota bacterium]|nr:GNAT family N-acetyltransferase [Actinomycetota bacterium]
MRIRRAEPPDLLSLDELFIKAAAYLVERYRPDQIGHISLVPGERVPLYEHLLRTGAVFVAEDPGPVGFSAAVIRDGVWFLSQLWVLPERHASGIGALLLDETLGWGRGSSAFSVVSSPHPPAQLLYLRASMFPLWTIHEMTGSDAAPPEPPEGVRPLEGSDGSWVDELDREVRGAARPEDHAWWRGRAHGLAVERAGAPVGYVYVSDGGRVGPGAARHPTDVPALVRAARHAAAGPVTFSVPSTNWAALSELVRSGFAPFGSTTFMASRPLGDGARYLSGSGALG